MKREDLIALKVAPELLDDATLREVPDVPTALKVLVDTKAHVGASIRVPGPDAPEADRKAFREKLRERVPELVEVPADPAKLTPEAEAPVFERLGRPKEAKGYPSLKDAGVELADGVRVDEELLRSQAHKLGLTRRQYVELARGVVAERAREVASRSEARQALRRELGEAFDDRLSAAAAVAKKFGAPEETVAAIKAGNVPADYARQWIGVAKAVGQEGGELGGQGDGGGGRMTPAEAREQIDELRRNPALRDPRDPRHDDLVAKLHKLTGVAYPD